MDFDYWSSIVLLSLVVFQILKDLYTKRKNRSFMLLMMSISGVVKAATVMISASVGTSMAQVKYVLEFSESLGDGLAQLVLLGFLIDACFTLIITSKYNPLNKLLAGTNYITSLLIFIWVFVLAGMDQQVSIGFKFYYHLLGYLGVIIVRVISVYFIRNELKSQYHNVQFMGSSIKERIVKKHLDNIRNQLPIFNVIFITKTVALVIAVILVFFVTPEKLMTYQVVFNVAVRLETSIYFLYMIIKQEKQPQKSFVVHPVEVRSFSNPV